MKTPRLTHPVSGALALAIVGCALALAACGSSSNKPTSSSTGSSAATTSTTSPTTPTTPTTTATAGGANVVSASREGVTATLHAHTHHPVVERAWPISFLVTRSGRPAHASVMYEYLFDGQVVAHRSHYSFDGSFADVFRWPASAVGYSLTFRAVIVAGGVTLDLDYPVQVVR